MTYTVKETRIAEIDTLVLIESEHGDRSILRFAPKWGPATSWGVAEKLLGNEDEVTWNTLGEPVEWMTRDEVVARWGEDVANLVEWRNP